MQRRFLEVLCGCLGYALIGAADLGHAIANYQKCQPALAGLPSVDMVNDGATVTLSIELAAIRQPVNILVETMLAATHRVMGWATNTRIPLRRVDVPHLLTHDRDHYDTIFGAPVKPGAARAALLFPAPVLRSPIVRIISAVGDREVPTALPDLVAMNSAGGRIGLNALRTRAGRYFDRVAAGETIWIVWRDRLVARIDSATWDSGAVLVAKPSVDTGGRDIAGRTGLVSVPDDPRKIA